MATALAIIYPPRRSDLCAVAFVLSVSYPVDVLARGCARSRRGSSPKRDERRGTADVVADGPGAACGASASFPGAVAVRAVAARGPGQCSCGRGSCTRRASATRTTSPGASNARWLAGVGRSPCARRRPARRQWPRVGRRPVARAVVDGEAQRVGGGRAAAAAAPAAAAGGPRGGAAARSWCATVALLIPLPPVPGA